MTGDYFRRDNVKLNTLPILTDIRVISISAKNLALASSSFKLSNTWQWEFSFNKCPIKDLTVLMPK